MVGFFSVAGIQTVGKPAPQVPSTDQNTQNPNQANTTTSNNSNEGTSTVPTVTTSQSNQSNTTNAASIPSQQQQQPQTLFQKYPGTGKLTIQKKKGKTGHAESIIRRVPVYTEDYDSSDDEAMNPSVRSDVFIPQRLLLQDEEAIFLDELDAEITRQEEKELLDKWNDEIIAQEEEDLMRRLWINIEHATYVEQCAAKPSAVLVVEDPNDDQNQDRPLLSMEMPKSKKSSQLVFPPTIGTNPTAATGVEITGEVDFCKASIKLPRYMDQEHKILAFRRGEFYTGVIQPFENDLLGVTDKSLVGWEASIMVSEEDPFSYVLQARGQKEVLEELKRQAELWVQDRIRMINSFLLLQDGASVVIENLVIPRLMEEEIKREKRNYKDVVVRPIEMACAESRPPALKEVKVQFKMHPDLCTIIVSGSTEVLVEISEATRDWVQTRSLYAIRDSFESSQLVSSTRGSPGKRIRMTFRYPRGIPLGYESQSPKSSRTQVPLMYSNCGVWLAGIKNRTLLALTMGSPAAFENGCILLAIDGKDCNSPNDLQTAYSQAREMERNSVKLRLCLSRYTDFSSIPELMDYFPRRLDGKDFDLSDYKRPDSIETQMMPMQQQKPATVEQPVATEQPATLAQEPDANFEPPDLAAPDEGDANQEPTYVPEPVPLEENGKSHEAWIHRLLENKKSIEMDVIFSSDKNLGASCSKNEVQGGGVLLFNPKEGGQILEALGEASKFHMVLWKVNGVVVQRIEHLEQLVKAAKKAERSLNCVLVMHEGTDLSQLDHSKLVQGGAKNPRRRNGDTRSLKNQLAPAKTSATIDSGVLASRQDETKDSQAKVDVSTDPDNNDNGSSDDDDSAPSGSKKKKANVSTKKSSESKTSSSIPSTAKDATTGRKAKGKDTSKSYSINDSDSHHVDSQLEDPKKSKRIPKKKDSISKATATNLTDTTGKRASQSSIVAPVPKKARVAPITKSILDGSTSAGGSSASADPSRVPKASQIGKVSRSETLASQKTSNSSVAANPRRPKTTNLSSRATSTGTASDPLQELLSVSTKTTKPTQKRAQSTQSLDEPAGKKLKGTSGIEAKRNVVRQVPGQAKPSHKSNITKGSIRMPEFEAEFPHSQPIGAFFKTEGSKCKVLSVFKNGQAKKDGKIMPGTIAVAVSISGKRQEISSHEELKELHAQARKRQSKIHIFFENTDVAGHRTDFKSEELDWTEYGKWRNRYDGGWAGGAKTEDGVAYMKNKLAMDRDSSAATSIETSRTENESTHREKNDAQNSQVRVDNSTRKPPSHQILRKRLGPCIRRKQASFPLEPVPLERRNAILMFSDDNPVKYFVVGSAADQWHDPHAVSNEVAIESHPLSPSDALEDAVINHRYTKMIEILESGMQSDFEVIFKTLQTHHDYVKQAAREANNEERAKDMTAKKKVLGIYIPLCLCIEQAMELQHTSAFRFCVKTVELSKKPNSSKMGRTETLSGRVSMKRGEHVHELGSLYKTKTKAFVSYTQTELRHFWATGNPELKLAKNYFFVDFREGAGLDAEPAAKLGSVSIPLSTCRQLKYDTPLDIVEALKVKSDSIISKGAVEVELYRKRASTDAVNKEKGDLIKRLNKEISWIKRFNDEFGGGRIKLSGNIRSAGGATLLHVAIHLGQEDMVKELLSVRADPFAKCSQYGTPINQATKSKDRSLEKLQNLIKNSKPPEETEPVQQLYELYSRILRLLKSNEEVDLPDDMKGISNDGQGNAGDKSSASQTRDAGATSEAVREKRQFEILQEIFSRAPKTAGGLEDGQEADKYFVGSMLRLHYGKECPDLPAMKKFVELAEHRKVLVSISDKKYRLGAATGSQELDRSTKKKDFPLPKTQLKWLHKGKKRCSNDASNKVCEYGHRCNYAHVSRYPTDTKSRLVLESKELLREKKDRFLLKPENLKTLKQDGWFTAGYHDPKASKSVYTHAEGGKGKANTFGVNWYKTLPEAKGALQRVLTAKNLNYRRRRDILSHEEARRHPIQARAASSQPNEGNRSLPHLKDRDWMDKSYGFPRRPSDVDPKSVQDRDFWQVEARFGDTIGHQFKIFLDPDDVYTKESKGFYTSAFADREWKKIIYVEGGNSKINDQGVHWYSSESEARNALEPVVSAYRKRSAKS